jgi:DNA-binding transcriptional ArsR family regulator
MSVSPVKRLIVETMWMLDRPVKATDISKDTGVSFPSIMMHMIGLTRMGYLTQPEKGYYTLTENGKKILGLPETNKEKAEEILAYLPVEKSFHFYADLGKPLGMHAASLQDFFDKIQKIDLSSIEFHVQRGDFEAWFAALGDAELARKMLLIREQKMSGEALRQKLCETVKNRYETLAKLRNS